MKIVELLNKLSLPITNEESDVLGMFSEKSEISKSELDPRAQVVANQLVNKDVLYRNTKDGKVYYRKKIQQS